MRITIIQASQMRWKAALGRISLRSGRADRVRLLIWMWSVLIMASRLLSWPVPWVRLKFWVCICPLSPRTLNTLWANVQSCILWSPLGTKELLPVIDAPVSCGYEVNIPENLLIVPLTGCHVKHLATCNVSMELLWLILFLPFWIIHVLSQIMESLQASTYSLQFLYINKSGQHKIATAICEEEIQLSPRAGGSQGKCIPRDPTGVPPTKPPAHTTGALPISNLNGKCGHVQ